ncbi:hypothetical protein Tco_1091755 [Tanacetum coccineum]|uniref:Uncharacterized protein n=1 Tax=Tanacetum coccineum TaxID=301880 RepID=A0ABQ5I9U0_9ASTR
MGEGAGTEGHGLQSEEITEEGEEMGVLLSWTSSATPMGKEMFPSSASNIAASSNASKVVSRSCVKAFLNGEWSSSEDSVVEQSSRYIVPPAGLDTISRNQVTSGSRQSQPTADTM